MQTYQPDHYRVLGVPFQADAAALREAYRKLSRVYHPDRHGGSLHATNCFQLISGAWTELSDPARRAHYDRLLALRDPLRLVDDPRAERALDVLDLVVKRLSRKPQALPAPRRGRDLRVRQTLPFAVAALGGLWQVEAELSSPCVTCRGEGTVDPPANPVCHVCQGVGSVKHGLRREAGSCGFCGGRGAVLLAPCGTCGGAGVVSEKRQVAVQVPTRCANGTLLRVRGGGERGAGPQDVGDLLVEVSVAPHALLRAEGDDLHCRVPLTWRQALQGGRVAVPTLEGAEWLSLPHGARTGQVIRIAQRGLPKAQGRGTLHVTLEIDFPEHLPASQRAELERLMDHWGDAPFERALSYAAAVTALPRPLPS